MNSLRDTALLVVCSCLVAVVFAMMVAILVEAMQ